MKCSVCGETWEHNCTDPPLATQAEAAPSQGEGRSIKLLDLWHLLFPEGTNDAKFESGDVAEWLDVYTNDCERYAVRIARQVGELHRAQQEGPLTEEQVESAIVNTPAGDDYMTGVTERLNAALHSIGERGEASEVKRLREALEQISLLVKSEMWKWEYRDEIGEICDRALATKEAPNG